MDRNHFEHRPSIGDAEHLQHPRHTDAQLLFIVFDAGRSTLMRPSDVGFFFVGFFFLLRAIFFSNKKTIFFRCRRRVVGD